MKRLQKARTRSRSETGEHSINGGKLAVLVGRMQLRESHKEEVAVIRANAVALNGNIRFAKKRTALGAVATLFVGDLKGSYSPKTSRVTLYPGRFGSKERREKRLNRTLIHETQHYVDDLAGELDKPVPKLMTIASNIGTKALRANMAIQAAVVAGVDSKNSIVNVVDGVTAMTFLAGLACYQLNPMERKARAAERVFYDPSHPIITINEPQVSSTPPVG